MARHLVRLKLALLRANLAVVGIKGKVAFGIAYLFAVIAGLGGGALFAALRAARSPDFHGLVPFGFALIFLVWIFGPVMAVAVENSLDVDRLALFPLRPSQMMPGLLLASMVGFGGLTTVLVLAGAVVGTAPISPLALVTVAAVAVEFATCVAASRMVSTALSVATRKRRWRDLALTAVPLAVFGVNIAFHAFLPANGQSEFHLPRGPFEVLPSGPASIAVVAAHDGRVVAALAALAASVLVLGALLQVWWFAIDRVLTTAAESGGPTGRRRASAESALFPRWARWLPANRLGAVAAKELRLQWREPRRRSGVIASVFVGVLPVLSLSSAQRLSHSIVVVGVFPAVVVAMAAINLYGFDGPAFWMHLAAGDDARSDLLGKNVETALLAGFMGLLSVTGLAVVTGGWEYVGPVLGLIVLGIGLELGMGNVASVTMPVAMPDSRTNAWASNASQGMQTMGAVFGSMFVSALVLGPLVALTLALRHRPGVLVGLAVLEVAAGVGVWRLGLGIAVRRSADRQPELLADLTRQRAS